MVEIDDIVDIRADFGGKIWNRRQALSSRIAASTKCNREAKASAGRFLVGCVDAGSKARFPEPRLSLRNQPEPSSRSFCSVNCRDGLLAAWCFSQLASSCAMRFFMASSSFAIAAGICLSETVRLLTVGFGLRLRGGACARAGAIGLTARKGNPESTARPRFNDITLFYSFASLAFSTHYRGCVVVEFRAQ